MSDMMEARLLIDHDPAAHDHHLCKLVDSRQMATVAELAKNAQFICRSCGRVAAKAESLCEPTKLE